MKVKSHIRAGSGAFAEAENSARQSNYSSVSQDIN